ncbi:unnamed protein product, partial [Porites lobata]
IHDSGDVPNTDVGKGWILATSSYWRNSVNSCYSSTNCSDDNYALDFYNTLSEVIKKLLGYKIICGDMNAQISPLEFDGFSFGKKTNRNGQFMLDMA